MYREKGKRELNGGPAKDLFLEVRQRRCMIVGTITVIIIDNTIICGILLFIVRVAIGDANIFSSEIVDSGSKSLQISMRAYFIRKIEDSRCLTERLCLSICTCRWRTGFIPVLRDELEPFSQHSDVHHKTVCAFIVVSATQTPLISSIVFLIIDA